MMDSCLKQHACSQKQRQIDNGPDAKCVPGRGPIERAWLAVQVADAPGGITGVTLTFARVGCCDKR